MIENQGEKKQKLDKVVGTEKTFMPNSIETAKVVLKLVRELSR